MPTFTIETLWESEHFVPNPNQRRAILHVDGPLYLPAGPGSGKTRVLLWRTLNLLVFHNIPPEAIYLSTFTEKAALQLREGLQALLGEVVDDIEDRRFRPPSVRDEHRYWTYFEDFGLDEEQEMWRAANLEAAATAENLTADFD